MKGLHTIPGEPGLHTTDLLDGVMAYENQEMNEEQVIAFFQRLVDNGMAWRLQGHYGRTAQALIDAGMVSDES